MRKIIIFSILFLLPLAFAQNESDWIFRQVDYPGESEMTASLIAEEGETVLKIESTDDSLGLFKLSKTISPPDTEWELTMDVRVTAPDIDLDSGDRALGNVVETEDNDGPNFMGFIYGYGDATAEDPGFITDTVSYDPYPDDSELCHVHFECNWAGPGYYGFFCASGSATVITPSWVADGEDTTSFTYSSYNGEEPFQPGEWRTVELDIGSGECNYKKLTIVFVGADFFENRDYIWEIKNIEIDATNDQDMKLENVYDYAEEEYLEEPAFCGNNKVDEGEECDGTQGLEEGYTCTDDCKRETECGDGIIAGDEVCDGSEVTEGYECVDCEEETPVCGDGMIVAEEMCDPESEESDIPPGFNCSSDCQGMEPFCGDGILVGDEECDGENGTKEGMLCSSECEEYRMLNPDEDELIGQVLTSAETVQPGSAASVVFNFTEEGSFSITDIEDQLKIKNPSIPGNASFTICVEGTSQCEEEYQIKSSDVLSASSKTVMFKPSYGTMKVYAQSDNSSTNYYIGLKAEGGGQSVLPIGGLGTLAVAVIALVIIGIMLLVVGILVFFYFRKKKTKKNSKKNKKGTKQKDKSDSK